MDDSILDTIKSMLGIEEGFTGFDTDILIDINAAFLTLNQLQVGPTDGFQVASSEQIWSDFTDDKVMVDSLRPYIYLKTRLLFDPPTNSYLLTSMENQCKEFEWRMNIRGEGTK